MARLAGISGRCRSLGTPRRPCDAGAVTQESRAQSLLAALIHARIQALCPPDGHVVAPPRADSAARSGAVAVGEPSSPWLSSAAAAASVGAIAAVAVGADAGEASSPWLSSAAAASVSAIAAGVYEDGPSPTDALPQTAIATLHAHRDEARTRASCRDHHESRFVFFQVWYVGFSPDGTMLATASADRTVIVWSVGVLLNCAAQHSERRRRRCVDEARAPLHARGFDREGADPADDSACANGVTHIDDVDPQDGGVLHTLAGHTQAVHALAWSPDSRMLLALAINDATIRRWDLPPRDSSAGPSLTAAVENGLTAVGVDQQQSAGTGAANGESQQASATALLTQCARVYSGHSEPVTAVAWRPERQGSTWSGATFVSGSLDRRVLLWHARTGTVRARDERMLARVASPARVQVLAEFMGARVIDLCLASPDGSQVAVRKRSRRIPICKAPHAWCPSRRCLDLRWARRPPTELRATSSTKAVS